MSNKLVCWVWGGCGSWCWQGSVFEVQIKYLDFKDIQEQLSDFMLEGDNDFSLYLCSETLCQ